MTTNIVLVTELYLALTEKDDQDYTKWTLEDVRKRYPDFNDLEAQHFIELLHDKLFCSVTKYEPQLIKDVIEESLHQDLDGWTDNEKVIIYAYLTDLGMACKFSSTIDE